MSGNVNSKEATAPLRDLIIASGLVVQRQIDDAQKRIEKRGGKLVETLIDMGCFDDLEFEKFISSQPGVPSIDLSLYKVMREVCQLLPEAFVIEHQVFPIDKMGKLLTVGMVVPTDAQLISELHTLTGLRVKSIYCRLDHIRGAIAKYYRPDDFGERPAPAAPASSAASKAKPPVDRSQGPSAMIRVAKLLREVEELPSLPETVEKTKEALRDDNVAIDDVIRIIEGDPSVSARLIRLANSGMYSVPNQIDNAGDAVKLLGLRETHNVVLASAILNFAESTKGLDFRRFWQEATFATSAVRGLAATLNSRAPSALVTAGLLHDIGRFALAHTVPEDFEKIDPKLTGLDLIAEEEDIFGLSHPEAAFILAQRWDLPEEIFTPIRYHHSPERTKVLRKEASIVCLAGYLAGAYSDQRKLTAETDFSEIQPALDALSMSPSQLVDAYRETVLTYDG